MKYMVLVIVEEYDEESGEREENVDFAETLGEFDNIAEAGALLRRVVGLGEVKHAQIKRWIKNHVPFIYRAGVFNA